VKLSRTVIVVATSATLVSWNAFADSAAPFSEKDLFSGTRRTEAECATQPMSVWVVVESQGDCIRYYAAGFAPGANPKTMVFLHGDRLNGTRPRNTLISVGGYKRATPDSIQTQVSGWAKNAGMPYIYFARPGTYGSSGDHTERRRKREIALTTAALDAIRARHGIEKFGLAGQSGGGFLTAAMLNERKDIACAALSSAPASLKRLLRDRGSSVDTTGHTDSVDPSDFVAKIPREPLPRIFVIGDPRDSNVRHSSQLDYLAKLEAVGQKPMRFDGVAPPPTFHSLDEHGRTAAMMCMNNRSDADIRSRLEALNVRAAKASPSEE